MFIYLDLSSSCIIIYLVDYPKQCVWGCRICEAEIQLVILRRGDTSLRQRHWVWSCVCVCHDGPSPWRIILHSRGWGWYPSNFATFADFFLSFWERKSFQKLRNMSDHAMAFMDPSWIFLVVHVTPTSDLFRHWISTVKTSRGGTLTTSHSTLSSRDLDWYLKPVSS